MHHAGIDTEASDARNSRHVMFSFCVLGVVVNAFTLNSVNALLADESKGARRSEPTTRNGSGDFVFREKRRPPRAIIDTPLIESDDVTDQIRDNEIPIWPDVAPGSENSTLKEEYSDRKVADGTLTPRDRSIAGVTEPTLAVYLPLKENATGTAVVVLPGGAFSHLAIDKEGHDVARWLRRHGIAGAVVKYRLPDPESGIHVLNGAIPDMQRAIRLVRHHAAKWNIDPRRIGVTGFSAGGYLAAAAGTLFDEGDPDADDPIQRVSCRPDFIAPIYPLVSLELLGERRARLLERVLGAERSADLASKYSPDNRVTRETPPTFLVHAHDDGLSVKHSVRFYIALRAANVSAELHVYSKGGHGYGMRQRGQPISTWRDRWLDWMRSEGFLETGVN